jgi:phasin family protein
MHVQYIKVLHSYHSTRNSMFAISEQLSHATKVAIDQQWFGLASFAQAAFDAGVGVVDLNVDAVKASMAAATVAANQLLCVRDGRDWMSLTTGQSQQALERASAYGRQAAEVASAAHERFSTIAQGKLDEVEEKTVESAAVVKKTQIRALAANTLSKITIGEAQEGYDIPVRAGKKATAETVVVNGASVTRGQA